MHGTFYSSGRIPVRSIIRSATSLGTSGIEVLRQEGIKALLFKIKEAYHRSCRASGISLLESDCKEGRPLLFNRTLSGKFRFTADRLNRLDILTVHISPKTAGLELTIADDSGVFLRRAIVKGRRVRDGGFTTFRFRPIGGSRGKSYTFTLRPTNPGIAAVIFDLAAESPIPIAIDDRPVHGSICLRAYAKLGRRRAYDVWIMKNEPDDITLGHYRKLADTFPYRPKISIITPVYNPDPRWIRAAIDSVIDQVYTNWELCIADASTNPEVRTLLRDYATRDDRIKVKILERNLGIAGNTNEALSMAIGEYFGFLDHDDELSSDALYEVARLLQDDPDADMIYSDEDFLNTSGVRIFPSFKPDWSPDLFLSGMYTCHLTIYKKSIADQVGQLRKEFDGAQDYDFALRYLEKAQRIRHIPRVLYHWRQTSSSTSLSLGNKKYADVAAAAAISDYMRRNGIAGEVTSGIWAGSYRVRRALKNTYAVSIIIYATDPRQIKRCLESVVRTAKNSEILLIDDTPGKNLKNMLEKEGLSDNVQVIEDADARGRPALSDIAARSARGDFLVFLRGDIEVIDNGWLDPMLEHVQRSEVGAAGCKLVYEDGRVQHAGMVIGMSYGPIKGIAGHAHRLYTARQHGYCGRIDMIQDLSAVTADCMVIAKSVYEKAGGFDDNLTIEFYDVDLCLRLRQKGLLIVYTPFSILRRHIKARNGPAIEMGPLLQKDIKYMREKWNDVLRSGDPYYSPNLSLLYDDIRIKL